MRILDGHTIIDVAGTAKQLIVGLHTDYGELESGQLPKFAGDLVVTAYELNAGDMVLGGEHCIATALTRSCLLLLKPGEPQTLNNVCLCELYVNAITAADWCYFGFMPRDETIEQQFGRG